MLVAYGFVLSLLALFVALGRSLSTAAEPNPTVRPVAGGLTGTWTLEARLSALVSESFAREPLGALSVSVVARGSVLWSGHYGTTTPGRLVPPNDLSVYRVGSVTKQFTALRLIQLVETGALNLSDSVEAWVPELAQAAGHKASGTVVSFHHLVTHTSGLAPESADASSYSRGAPSDWDKALIKGLASASFQSDPGLRFVYGNLDYAVLGLALQRVSDQDFVDGIQEHITAPLGMLDTSFNPSPEQQDRLVHGAVLQSGRLDPSLPDRELSGRGYKVPGGGLFSTLKDLGRFVAWQTAGPPAPVLTPVGQALMAESVVVSSGDLGSGYGLGFQVFRTGQSVLLGHLGGVSGYRSLTAFDPVSRTGVAILHNVTGDQLDLLALAHQLVEAVHSHEQSPDGALSGV